MRTLMLRLMMMSRFDQAACEDESEHSPIAAAVGEAASGSEVACMVVVDRVEADVLGGEVDIRSS
jgi:hypothetical protein